MEKLFKLRENGTDIHTEVLAGLTTFMTMAYIIALNPNLLTNFAVGTPLWNGVFLATCIASAIGTFFMAFMANKPFAMAPGMGLNTFFAVVVSNIAVINSVEYEDAFQAGLCIILIEGIVFLILSILNVREKLVDAIPLEIRQGFSPAIGLMLMNIGFGSNAGIYAEGNDYTSPFYVLRDFFGAMTPVLLKDQMGKEYSEMVVTVITIFVGIITIVILAKHRIKAAVLIGMLASSILYWATDFVVFGKNPFASLKDASFMPPVSDMVSTTFFKFDFTGLFDIGFFTATTLVITLLMLDMFDTIGTLVGTATAAGMIDKDGNMPNMKGALISDALGTIAGACAGTSTVTTYVESASGVEAGGRTGLTAIVTALAFLACTFLAPIAAIIPPAATSSALIYVGILMLQGLSVIDFSNIDQVAPVFIMLIAMPVSGSVGHSIGLAMISYTFIKVFSGKAKEVSLLTYIISILFIVKFFWVV